MGAILADLRAGNSRRVDQADKVARAAQAALVALVVQAGLDRHRNLSHQSKSDCCERGLIRGPSNELAPT